MPRFDVGPRSLVYAKRGRSVPGIRQGRDALSGPSTAEDTHYHCPHCVTPLGVTGSKLCCPQCNREFSQEHGVPSFTDRPLAGPDEVSEDEYAALLRALGAEADAKSAVEATAAVLSTSSVERIAPFADPARHALARMLDLSPDARLLELDFGHWSNIGVALSEQVAQVDVVQLVPQRLSVAASLRATREHAYFAARSDALPHLPFAPEAFDAVLIGGGLAWYLNQVDEHPAAAERHLFAEIHRVLKPAGQLHLVAENRLAYSHMLGARDGVTGSRFIQCLPRWLASSVAGLKGMRFRAHQHTLRGYERRLRHAGFSATNSWFVHPDGRLPRFAIPVQSPNVPQPVRDRVYRSQFAPLSRGNWKSTAKDLAARAARTRWGRQFASAFVIRAAKDAPALERGLINDVVRDAAGADAQALMVLVRGTNVMILPTYEPRHDRLIYIKLPLTERGNNALHKHYAFIEWLQNDLADKVPVPKPLGQGAVGRQAYYVESALDGTAGSRLSADKFELAQRAAEVLADFHIATRGDHVAQVAALWAERFDELADDEQIGKFDGFDAFRAMVLERIGRSPCSVLAHNDYYLENLIFDGTNRVAGILDWDMADRVGLPVVDVVHLLVGTTCSQSVELPPEAIQTIHAGKHPRVSRCFEDYCRRLDIEPDMTKWFSIYAAARIWSLYSLQSYVVRGTRQDEVNTGFARDLVQIGLRLGT